MKLTTCDSRHTAVFFFFFYATRAARHIYFTFTGVYPAVRSETFNEQAPPIPLHHSQQAQSQLVMLDNAVATPIFALLAFSEFFQFF